MIIQKEFYLAVVAWLLFFPVIFSVTFSQPQIASNDRKMLQKLRKKGTIIHTLHTS